MYDAAHRLSVAPMMELTDRHYRYLVRRITQCTVLYTEMLTTGAVLNGDREYLLGKDSGDNPVVLQLGGSDPVALSEAASIGEEWGYDGINLNVGCPSDRVKSGRFGACLMAEPALVGDCVQAMQSAVNIPVTVKCRLGIDRDDSYEALRSFVEQVASKGCQQFIVHARKAWLDGLSPKENRTVPPLRYEYVYRLKQEFPSLKIDINGGICTLAEAERHLEQVDGVMAEGCSELQGFYFSKPQSAETLEKAGLLRRKTVPARSRNSVDQLSPSPSKDGDIVSENGETNPSAKPDRTGS